MLLYLTRHGQTNWNLIKRLQGQSDIPLNDHGMMTAKLTGEQLKSVPFTRALSSPLKRAYKTCELILENRPILIEKEPDLMEISFGDYEGYCATGEPIVIPNPEFYDNFFHHPEQYVAPPNGESFEMLRKRARRFLNKLVNKTEWKDDIILATAHGTIICAILAELHNYDITHFWGKGVPRNCSITTIRFENGTITIEEEDKVLFTLD